LQPWVHRGCVLGSTMPAQQQNNGPPGQNQGRSGNNGATYSPGLYLAELGDFFINYLLVEYTMPDLCSQHSDHSFYPGSRHLAGALQGRAGRRTAMETGRVMMAMTVSCLMGIAETWGHR
jgi:hypothetical protein